MIRQHWLSAYLFDLRGLNTLRVAQMSHTLVDQVDLSAIEAYYEQEERSYPPYHPRMMTKWKAIVEAVFGQIRHRLKRFQSS